MCDLRMCVAFQGPWVRGARPINLCFLVYSVPINCEAIMENNWMQGSFRPAGFVVAAYKDFYSHRPPPHPPTHPKRIALHRCPLTLAPRLPVRLRLDAVVSVMDGRHKRGEAPKNTSSDLGHHRPLAFGSLMVYSYGVEHTRARPSHPAVTRRLLQVR